MKQMTRLAMPAYRTKRDCLRCRSFYAPLDGDTNVRSSLYFFNNVQDNVSKKIKHAKSLIILIAVIMIVMLVLMII